MTSRLAAFVLIVPLSLFFRLVPRPRADSEGKDLAEVRAAVLTRHEKLVLPDHAELPRPFNHVTFFPPTLLSSPTSIDFACLAFLFVAAVD